MFLRTGLPITLFLRLLERLPGRRPSCYRLVEVYFLDKGH